MYDSLMDYYRQTRGPRVSAERRRRIEEATAADQVERTGPVPTKKNHYLFVGENGNRLSGQTYNNHLKKYFDKIGIPVDKGSRQANCSHKLRHTFAMLLTTYTEHPASREQLRDMLRHRSVASGERYYTPTQEQVLQMKEKLVKAIYEMIPGLGD